MVNTKLLGLQIDNHLNLKNHVDQTIPKLSGACYAVRSSSTSATLTLSDQFISLIFTTIKHETVFGVICPTVER
jgi:hypothetical protein